MYRKMFFFFLLEHFICFVVMIICDTITQVFDLIRLRSACFVWICQNCVSFCASLLRHYFNKKKFFFFLIYTNNAFSIIFSPITIFAYKLSCFLFLSIDLKFKSIILNKQRNQRSQKSSSAKTPAT